MSLVAFSVVPQVTAQSESGGVSLLVQLVPMVEYLRLSGSAFSKATILTAA